MEVLKSNFESVLPEMLESLRQADFVAIDANVETTGFLMPDETLNSRQLQGREWYNVLKKHQKTRSPLEFGIAIFTQDRTQLSKRYDVKCYNVPMLFAYVEEHDARQDIRDAKHGEERLDIDGIGYEFLQKINYDLNKTLYDGTPFINLEMQKEAIEYMTKNPDFMIIDGKHVTNGDLDVKYFPKVIEKLEANDIREIIERLRGIGKIFDVTAETNVPVIGHNLFIKLIELYKDFVEFLPNHYSEFLVKLEKVLPQFYDTKYICWEINERPDVLKNKKLLIADSKLYPAFRNLDWIGQFSLRFALDEQSTVYQLDLEDLSSEILEDDPTSFCYESGFDAMLSGIMFTKLAILACGEFGVEKFSEYAKLWKNKVYIQEDYKDVLYTHETEPTTETAPLKTDISAAGLSKADSGAAGSSKADTGTRSSKSSKNKTSIESPKADTGTGSSKAVLLTASSKTSKDETRTESSKVSKPENGTRSSSKPETGSSKTETESSKTETESSNTESGSSKIEPETKATKPEPVPGPSTSCKTATNGTVSWSKIVQSNI